MSLLKKENWLVNLLLMFIGQNIYILLMAYMLKNFKKDAWYANPVYWIVGIILCFFPAAIMFLIFTLQMMVENAKKLNVPGSEIYGNPYIWIVLFIIPIIGWSLFTIMIIYLSIWWIVMIYRGEGEKYIEK